MRALRMNKRSVYCGMRCQHCHKHIAAGRVFLGTTLYVIPGKSWVRTQSTKLQGLASFFNEPDEEMQIRLVYHRACLEKILRHGPLDHEIEIAQWEEYRSSLLERFGVEGAADEDR